MRTIIGLLPIQTGNTKKRGTEMYIRIRIWKRGYDKALEPKEAIEVMKESIRVFKPTRITWVNHLTLEMEGAELLPLNAFDDIQAKIEGRTPSSRKTGFFFLYAIEELRFEDEEKEKLDTLVLSENIS